MRDIVLFLFHSHRLGAKGSDFGGIVSSSKSRSFLTVQYISLLGDWFLFSVLCVSLCFF
jgi:hypothetical protein